MPSKDYRRYATSKQRKQRTIRIILEILISSLLITLAIISTIYGKEFFEKKLSNGVKLDPCSEGFKSWLNPPISTTRSYYLFNITNPIDIVTDPSSTAIKCKDTPPYTYNIKTRKTNVHWTNNNTEVRYAVERLFTRDQKRFKASSVNDTGIFIDLLRAIFRTQFGPKPTPAFYSIGGNQAFYHRNVVKQLEGFTSDLFTSVREKMIGPNTDKSGIVYRQNGSRLYNVSIQTDVAKKGQVLTFDSELVPFNITSPSHYPFPVYDSLTYPPMLFDKPALNLFNSDFCRPILIEFNQVVSMFGGMKMHEYKVKLIDIDNCTDSNDTRTCNEVDKLDVSKCVSDSLDENTIFLSKAHFYGSSNETIQQMNIEGFTPISDKHDSVVYFEPNTGTPFKAVFRMQLNIEATVDPMKLSEDTLELEPRGKKGVKRLIPVFWLDQEINIAKKVIITLRIALFLRQYGRYVYIPLAVVLSITIIVIMEMMAKRAARRHQYTRGAYIKAEALVK